MRKLAVIAMALCFALVGCSKKVEDPNTVTVGTIDGPETKLMQIAQQVAKQRYGLNVKIVAFSDYATPNQALSDGSIDVNAFQHVPYMKAEIKAHGYKIVPVGKTFLYPMAIYSTKLKKLYRLKYGETVAVPNDPSNEARALLLLQKVGLITLKKDVGVNATPVDIIKNFKRLKFVELDAAELPRALSDVAIAVINTNFAIPAGLSPSKDALMTEGTDSPYINVIAAREDNKDTKKVKELVQAYQSQTVRDEARRLFNGNAIAGW